MAGLSLTFWPNPVCRNHTGERRWYFHVSLQELEEKRIQLYRYRGEWYDMEGRLQDSKEESLETSLAPLQHISYADLWVTSALARFRYRLIVFGRDQYGREVWGEGELLCQ